MGKMKNFKPVTPGQRFKTVADFSDLSDVKPLKKLTKGLKNTAGRSNQGRISMRRQGGGHKRRYRMIDFKRNKLDVKARVATIEYDPNRSARIALLHYTDGEKRYILHPLGLKVGMTIVVSKKAKIDIGNALCLKHIPDGTLVHNLELYPGRGGQLVRSAGQSAQILGKEGNYCNVKLPSGEVRRIFSDCMATIGQLGNTENENIMLGKAGRARWLNKRPKVRGVAMNPVDHPHGGGEGKTSGGRHPVSPWGKPTKGYKTRKKNKPSEKFILYRKKKKR